MAATLSLSFIETLTDIREIEQKLAEVIELERRADEELERQRTVIAAGRGGVDTEVLSLVAELEHIAPAIRSVASSTVSEAESVIARTRALDSAHSRVQKALERVEDVIDLKSCLAGVQLALQSSNLQAAATHVKRFRGVEKLVPVAEEDRDSMRRAEGELSAIVEARFQHAISSHDVDGVTACCQLMNILGHAEKGLDRYSTFLCQKLQGELASERRRLQPAANRSEPAATVNLVSAVLARGVTLLQEAEAVARSNFEKEGGPARVLAAMHQECDSITADILTAFVRTDRVRNALEQAPTSTRAGAAAAAAPAPLTEAAAQARREADGLLSEIALVVQRCMSYMHLVTSKAEAVDAAAESYRRPVSPKSLSPTAAAAVATAADAPELPRAMVLINAKREMMKAVAELAGIYCTLEERFLTQGVSMAVTFDEIVEDNWTTSMIEESFYVLQQCGVRALATGSAECVCGTVNYIVRCLEASLLSEVSARLDRAATQCGNAGVAATGDGSAAAGDGPAVAKLSKEFVQLAVTVNNIELGDKYATQLTNQLKSQAQQVFPSERNESKMVMSCMHDLTEVVEKFSRLSAAAVSKLCSTLTPRLRTALNVFSGAASLIQYELTEDHHIGGQAYDKFNVEFLRRLEELIQPFQPVLSATMFSAMVTKVAVNIAKNLETLLMRKRFTQLGSMQFERDMRALVAFFVDRSSAAVRSKLTRLTQLSRLLNLDMPMELLEYWGTNEGLVPWEFNAAEAKRLLALRVEFQQIDIDLLPL